MCVCVSAYGETFFELQIKAATTELRNITMLTLKMPKKIKQQNLHLQNCKKEKKNFAKAISYLRFKDKVPGRLGA